MKRGFLKKITNNKVRKKTRPICKQYLWRWLHTRTYCPVNCYPPPLLYIVLRFIYSWLNPGHCPLSLSFLRVNIEFLFGLIILRSPQYAHAHARLGWAAMERKANQLFIYTHKALTTTRREPLTSRVTPHRFIKTSLPKVCWIFFVAVSWLAPHLSTVGWIRFWSMPNQLIFSWISARS